MMPYASCGDLSGFTTVDEREDLGWLVSRIGICLLKDLWCLLSLAAMWWDGRERLWVFECIGDALMNENKT